MPLTIKVEYEKQEDGVKIASRIDEEISTSGSSPGNKEVLKWTGSEGLKDVLMVGNEHLMGTLDQYVSEACRVGRDLNAIGIDLEVDDYNTHTSDQSFIGSVLESKDNANERAYVIDKICLRSAPYEVSSKSSLFYSELEGHMQKIRETITVQHELAFQGFKAKKGERNTCSYEKEGVVVDVNNNETEGVYITVTADKVSNVLIGALTLFEGTKYKFKKAEVHMKKAA